MMLVLGFVSLGHTQTTKATPALENFIVVESEV